MGAVFYQLIHMKNRPTLFFALIISLLIGSCGEEEGDPVDLSFRVDSTLLEKGIHDPELGFSFSPPQGCMQLPDEMKKEVEKVITGTLPAPDSLFVVPRHFFYNDEERSLCLVSALPELSIDGSAIAAYQGVIKSKMVDHDVNQSRFLHSGFLIYQSRVITDEMVLFKLVIPRTDHRSFQVDYVNPKSVYQKNLRAIESSIGSIKKEGD